MTKRLDALGDRLKGYERAETNCKFLPMMPVYVRLYGRGFSKFTKGMDRPYDVGMSSAMQEVTKYLVEKTGALTGYTQSDEISLVYYQDNPKGDIFFSGKKQKMCSTLAAMASVKFYDQVLTYWPEKADKLPTFDCRAFQVPNEVEVMNCFLWRVQDAVKNSVSMAASSVYSHKQLMYKNSKDKLDMLHEKGVDWNEYPKFFKEGSFFKREKYLINQGTTKEAVRTRVSDINLDKPFKDYSTEERVEIIMEKYYDTYTID